MFFCIGISRTFGCSFDHLKRAHALVRKIKANNTHTLVYEPGLDILNACHVTPQDAAFDCLPTHRSQG
eukprot:7452895-Karenia_brevis.AAC.1